MTTILYHNKTLFGDMRRSLNHQETMTQKVYLIENPKLDIIINSYKIPSGPIMVGCAGDSSLCTLFVEYLSDRIDSRQKLPDFKGWGSFSAILISSEFKCYEVADTLSIIDVSDSTIKGTYSIGTGSPFALGAIAAGKSGGEAIQIASMFDNHTSKDYTQVSF